jgi:RNA polymerase sigma factor (sigma-70 family)
VNEYADETGKLTPAGTAELSAWAAAYEGKLELCLTGNPRFRRIVFTLLNYAKQGMVDLEEVRQDILAHAARRMRKYDPANEQGASLRTYLAWSVAAIARDVLRRLATMKQILSLDYDKTWNQPAMPKGEKDRLMHTTVRDRRTPDPAAVAEVNIDGPLGEFAGMLRFLSPKLRDILLARYAADESLQTVADRLGVSRERVRQLEVTALNRLRVEMGLPEDPPKIRVKKKRVRTNRWRKSEAKGVAA